MSRLKLTLSHNFFAWLEKESVNRGWTKSKVIENLIKNEIKNSIKSITKDADNYIKIALETSLATRYQLLQLHKKLVDAEDARKTAANADVWAKKITAEKRGEQE
jgi:hypothetical protein